MAFFDPQDPQQQTAFNYGTEQDKIKRRRALADMLMQQSQQQNQGQFIKSGDFTGFAGGNTLGSTLARGLMAYLGTKTQGNADQQQGQLDQRSVEELQKALQDKPWEQAARDQQVQREGDAEFLRESRRGPIGDGSITPSTPVTQAPPPAYRPAQDSQQASAALGARLAPMPSKPTSTLGAQLQAGAGAGRGMVHPPLASDPQPVMAPPTQEQQLQQLDVLRAQRKQAAGVLGTYSGVKRNADPQGFQAATQTVSALDTQIKSLEDQIAPAAGLLRKPLNAPAAVAPALAAKLAPASPQNAPTAPSNLAAQLLGTKQPASAVGAPAAPTPVLPSQFTPPQPSQSAPAQPAQNPFAGVSTAPGTGMLSNGQTVQVSDPRMMTDQAAASAQPSTGQQLAQIERIANTGDLGRRVADAQLQQMFGGKGGEFKVELNRDPNSGQLSIVRYNTRTGQVDVQASGQQAGDRVLETKDTPSGIMERTANGWRPARDMQGNVVGGKEFQDTSEKNAKTAAELDSQIAAGDQLRKSLASLTSIDASTGKPRIDSATGIGGQLSLLYNTITRDPTKASQAQADVDSLKSQMFLYGMAKLKAAGGGAGGANSDAEGKRLEIMMGNLDLKKLGTEGFIRKSNEIMSEIDAASQRVQNAAGQQGLTLQTRQPGQAPQQLSYSAFKGGR